jgi:prolyl-tRNA synthetase
LLIQTERGPYLAVVRGDRILSLPKFKRSVGVVEAELAQDLTGLPEGQIGPIGQAWPVVADYSVAGIQTGVAVANEPGYHWVNGSYPLDFEAQTLADLTLAQEGDCCGVCEGPLSLSRGIEVGQVFYLGTKYSKPMEAVFLDADGNKKPTVMGCYGIGIGRTIAATVEQCHDDQGILWPVSLAPFAVHLVLLDTRQSELALLADSLYSALMAQGVDVLYDDREERPGVKFHDADLIGLPLRLTIGKKYKEKGLVEIKARDASFTEDVPPEDAGKRIHAFLSQQGMANG